MKCQRVRIRLHILIRYSKIITCSNKKDKCQNKGNGTTLLTSFGDKYSFNNNKKEGISTLQTTNCKTERLVFYTKRPR